MILLVFSIIFLVVRGSLAVNLTLTCDSISDTSAGYPYCFIRHVTSTNEINNVHLVDSPDAYDKRELIFDNCSFVAFPLGFFGYLSTVRTIYAWNTGLRQLHSDAFINAHHLTTLDLTKNEISNLSAETFSHASNLKLLQLTQNKVNAIDRLAFFGLSRLRALHLDYNEIVSLDASVFSPLGRLQVLRLNNNRIKAISSTLFALNLQLANIHLQENGIEQFDGERTFLYLVNVREFDMHNNPIENHTNCVIDAQTIDIRWTRAKSAFIGLHTKRLIAADNRITSVVVSDGAEKNLLYVDLANNALTQMRNFSHCEALVYLDLSHNHITDIAIDSFASMHSLEVLRLRNSGLRTIQFGLLSHKMSLKELDISFNHLVTINFNMFMSMGNLRSLYLDGNNITNMDMSEVRKVFPSLVKIGIARNSWRCTQLAAIVKSLDSNGIALSSIGMVKDKENIRGIPCDEVSTTATSRTEPSSERSKLNTLDGGVIVKLIALKYESMDAVKQIKSISRKLQDLLEFVQTE